MSVNLILHVLIDSFLFQPVQFWSGVIALMPRHYMRKTVLTGARKTVLPEPTGINCPAWAHRPPKEKCIIVSFLSYVPDNIFSLVVSLHMLVITIFPLQVWVSPLVLVRRYRVHATALHAQDCPDWSLAGQKFKAYCSLCFMLQVEKELVLTNFRGHCNPL